MGLDQSERLGPSLLEAVARVVELACLAPSVRNAQPWRWRLAPDGLQLWVDPARTSPDYDPDGRMRVLSCGAALDHALVAARGLGLRVEVERTPSAAEPDLLARLRLGRAPGASGGGEPPAVDPRDVAALHALLERRTDRRRFTTWPVPPDHLDALAGQARSRGALAEPLLDLGDRVRVGRLLGRADDRLRRAAGEPPAFLDSPVVAPDRDLEPGDGLLVLGSAPGHDDPTAWLAVGEALSALWLHATGVGLSVVPLSAVNEVAETRAELARDVLAGRLEPQLLVRIGWQPIGRPRRTPRRPLADVLAVL
ncbi:hypothetical protein K8Z61_14910 [Nocardioides sp. TRM66260-LWL]|uniref:hypothetical protein n=1 Tax=Nocardioides sp. TRM66260-LWL TaxID=2874478 RepID=UPI001CC3C6EC|nr:hypothetical protein [Nocardioides sp. TRM66260-LWL]MBZ5735782.1 hypothetical protein [Nocardioides sp. TRM66260-LWL]